MAHLSQSRRWRIIIPIVLLGMIFMRMIWMQLRVYPPMEDARAIIALEFLSDHIDSHCRFEHYIPAEFIAPNATATTASTGRIKVARAAFTSVGYSLQGLFLCREDWLQERAMGRLNQWLFISAVIAAVLMTRFIASNWTVSLIVGAMLLSRGRLLGALGMISPDNAISLVLMLWLAATAHFLRTGATISLVAMAAAVLAGVAFDRALLALAFVPLLLIGFAIIRRRHLTMPVIRRFRGARQRARRLIATVGPPPLDGGSVFQRFSASARWMVGLDFAPVGPDPREPANYARGGLFRTIQVPFLLWLFAQRRYLKLALASLAITVLAGAFCLALFLWAAAPWAGADWSVFAEALRFGPESAWTTSWFVTGISRVDVHLGLCLGAIILSGFQSPAAGLPSFLELSWTLLLGLALVAAFAFGLDTADQGLVDALHRSRLAPALFQEVGNRSVTAWFEPALLSLGTVGFYNLMKVLDTRLQRRA